MKYVNLPMVIGYCLQTSPFWGLHFERRPKGQIGIVPQSVVPIALQICTADAEPYYTYILDAVMLDDCIAFVTVSDMQVMVNKSLRDGKAWIALQSPSIDVSVADRAQLEFPVAHQLVRSRNYPPDMTVDKIEIEYADAIEVLFKKFIESGKARNEDGTDTFKMLPFKFKIKQRVLLAGDNPLKKYYMCDLIPLSPEVSAWADMLSTEHDDAEKRLWGGVKTQIPDLVFIIDRLTQEAYTHGQTMGVRVSSKHSKPNLDFKVPAFTFAEMKWIALKNVRLESTRTLTT